MDLVILRWTFSPADFFEGRIDLKRKDYEMIIDLGKVEARIRPEVYGTNPHMREDLHRALNRRFLGAQLLIHKRYDLSHASMYRLHPDGRKDVTVFAQSVHLKSSTTEADISIRNKTRNNLSDPRRKRINRKKALADLVEKYGQRDMTAISLLKSYQASVNDPSNELVHLFEIPDALSKKFGKDVAARKALNVDSSEWRDKWGRLISLTNNACLKQGRHRGQSLGMLRDATREELVEARTIARDLIQAYLQYVARVDVENG
jgi:hypothetical protein